MDPLSGLRAIMADGSGDDGLSLRASPPLQVELDALAEGHEEHTLPELAAVRPGGGPADGPGWSVRVLPSAAPALSAASPPAAPEANRDLFWAGPALGAHELIVSSPQAVSSLCELGADQLEAAVEVWRDRMRRHERAAYVHVTVEEGVEARPEPLHSHAQLYALDFVPAAVARERERFGAYATRTMGGNLLADLVQEEVRRRERIVAIDDDCVLISPWAPRSPFQLLIAPRRPRARFEDDGPTGARMLGEALRRLVARFGAPPPLALWVRTAPRGAEHFCWRIDVVPRVGRIGGLELGTGVPVIPVAPERAAAELQAL